MNALVLAHLALAGPIEIHETPAPLPEPRCPALEGRELAQTPFLDDRLRLSVPPDGERPTSRGLMFPPFPDATYSQRFWHLGESVAQVSAIEGAPRRAPADLAAVVRDLLRAGGEAEGPIQSWSVVSAEGPMGGVVAYPDQDVANRDDVWDAKGWLVSHDGFVVEVNVDLPSEEADRPGCTAAAVAIVRSAVPGTRRLDLGARTKTVGLWSGDVLEIPVPDGWYIASNRGNEAFYVTLVPVMALGEAPSASLQLTQWIFRAKRDTFEGKSAVRTSFADHRGHWGIRDRDATVPALNRTLPLGRQRQVTYLTVRGETVEARDAVLALTERFTLRRARKGETPDHPRE